MKGTIGLYYQITVKDKNGKIVSKTRQRRSKSIVVAFLEILQNLAFGVNLTHKVPIGGGTATMYKHETNFKLNAGVGVVANGIVIGTGTTPPANDDYVLETLIAHGSGATQINYAAVSMIAAQEVGANVDFQVIRAMQNLSGNTINVTEAGIYAICYSDNYCIVHDIFTAVPVADGETITVTYTFRTTV